jgi:hypothetical protein
MQYDAYGIQKLGKWDPTSAEHPEFSGAYEVHLEL